MIRTSVYYSFRETPTLRFSVQGSVPHTTIDFCWFTFQGLGFGVWDQGGPHGKLVLVFTDVEGFSSHGLLCCLGFWRIKCKKKQVDKTKGIRFAGISGGLGLRLCFRAS